MSLTSLLSTIDSEIAALTRARNLIAGLAKTSSSKRKYKMSTAARKKIAAAQKKRWAAVRKAAK